MYSNGPPHMAVQKQDDQQEHTFSNYVRIRDVVLKTYLGRWTIGRSGERGSGISVLPARYDDDDEKKFSFSFKVSLSIFSCEILLVFRLKRPQSCFSSHFCFKAIFVLSILVLSVLFLVAIISLPLRLFYVVF